MLTSKGKIKITLQEQKPVHSAAQKSKKIIKQEKILKKKKRRAEIHQERNKAHDINLQEQQDFQVLQESNNNACKIAHLAICFPDSILEIPQTSALRAYFISEIARIASIFKVDEIVILKDHGYTQKSQKFIPCDYIARNLQYLQTPQYLRKYLFKMHPDLNNVGLMNPVQSKHHLKVDEKSQFRDGVALERPTKTGAGSWVDIGLQKQARMDHLVLPLTRVTLRIKNYQDNEANVYEAEAVSKSTPRLEQGLYWGYDVRIANTLKEILSDYDYMLLCNHSPQSYELPQIQNIQSLPLGQKKVMVYFSGTDDIDELIKRYPKHKVTAEEFIAKFDYSVRLPLVGVKQLRLQQRMSLTLSKFMGLTY